MHDAIHICVLWIRGGGEYRGVPRIRIRGFKMKYRDDSGGIQIFFNWHLIVTFQH